MYLDDDETYDYKNGGFVYWQFKFKAKKLTSITISNNNVNDNKYLKSIGNSIFIKRVGNDIIRFW